METRPINHSGFPYTQVRVARPTASLHRIIEFYGSGLGLVQIGSFDEHGGISGVMFGMPGATYHWSLHNTGRVHRLIYPPPTTCSSFIYPE